MKDTIFSAFADRGSAEEAINELKDAGIQTEQMSVVTRTVEETKAIEGATGVGEAAVKGAVTGGVLGAIAGLLIGASVITLPGIGGIAIAGPIAAALGISTTAASTIAGAATGTIGGGLIASLIGLGIPEDVAKAYEQTIRDEGVVLGIKVDEEDRSRVVDILTQNKATYITS
jgi:uncharacterized membrane protein